MSWLSKRFKKDIKILDPAGAAIRKKTGGNYMDPLNQYQSGPKPVVPYVRPERPGLQPNPGTGGPTVKLGGSTGGYNYQANPFASQMAQAAVLRNPMQSAPQPQIGMAPPQQQLPSIPNGIPGMRF